MRESWETKNNCKECDYKINNNSTGHCYIFEFSPVSLCMQHSELKNSSLEIPSLATQVTEVNP